MLWKQKRRREELIAEVRKLAEKMEAGAKTIPYDTDAQGKLLVEYHQLVTKLADEFDHGWRERGSCKPAAIPALRSLPGLPDAIYLDAYSDLLD